MRSPSLAPTREPLHFVLCDFGKLGLAYVETRPVTTEAQVVDGILHGQYDDPVEVIAVSVDEGMARDWFKKFPKAAYDTKVESWRAPADGKIEFTMRRLPTAD